MYRDAAILKHLRTSITSLNLVFTRLHGGISACQLCLDSVFIRLGASLVVKSLHVRICPEAIPLHTRASLDDHICARAHLAAVVYIHPPGHVPRQRCLPHTDPNPDYRHMVVVFPGLSSHWHRLSAWYLTHPHQRPTSVALTLAFRFQPISSLSLSRLY